MQQRISYPTPERQTPTKPTVTVSRLRTVTGNRFPRKCACGCGHAIPRDPGSATWSISGPRGLDSQPIDGRVSHHRPNLGRRRGGPSTKRGQGCLLTQPNRP